MGKLRWLGVGVEECSGGHKACNGSWVSSPGGCQKHGRVGEWKMFVLLLSHVLFCERVQKAFVI